MDDGSPLPGQLSRLGAEKLRWEEVPSCPACGATERRPVREYVVDVEHSYVRCLGCGLFYLAPRPVKAFIDCAYDGGLDIRQTERQRLLNRIGTRHRYLETMALIERFAPRKGRLLDVGCSGGAFLLVAKELGWKVAGVDTSRGAVEACRKRGVDARVEDIAVTPRVGERYDVVTALHVLEHTPDPVAFLSAVRERTKDAGLVVVDVPNIISLSSRWKRTRARYGLRRNRINSPKHLLGFGEPSFRYLARKVGLGVLLRHTYSQNVRKFGPLVELCQAFLRRFPIGGNFRFLLRKRALPRAQGGSAPGPA